MSIPAPGQLRIARQCQDEFGLWFPLVRAAGEQVPLRDASFDLVISEYGAAIWADPYLGFPRRHACYIPAVSSSSSATAPC